MSDTHVSARLGVPAEWTAFARWLRDDPPDLVVHSGDIVFEDPDDDADHALGLALVGALAVPVAVIPGNHDVGGYDETDRLPARLERFTSAWGADRFRLDVGGWRVVGVNAYLLGDAGHDRWLADAATAAGPTVVFVHQPLAGDPADGWEMPPGAAAAFRDAVATADVRVVASGHRHCAAVRDGDGGPWTAWWAPSLRLAGTAESAGRDSSAVDPRPGVLEHVLAADGTHRARVVHF